MRIPVEKLALGMFVSELDCPWSDTPFLLQGLLLETEAELDVICRLCREVTVDLSRSVGMEDAARARGTAGASADNWQATSAWVELPDEAVDRHFSEVIGEKALQESLPGDDRQEPWVTARGISFRWSLDVLRELLENYLRPPPPAVAVYASEGAAKPAPGRRTAATPGRGFAASLRMGAARAAARRRALEARQALPPTATATMLPMPEVAPEPGAWASIRRMFSELLSRRRVDPVEAAPAAGCPAALPAAAAQQAANAADYARAGPSLWLLCWRVLLKLVGLGRTYSDIAPAIVVLTPDPRMHDAPPAEDLTAKERAEAVRHAERFEAELPRAALTLRQSMPVVLAAYRSAENDLPLAMETLDPVVTEIVDGVLRNQDAVLWLTRLQSHDQTAHARGLQAAVYMAHLGSHLGLPREDLKRLALGGALLDIGKMQVPKEILRKPGPLDADEMRHARSHVEIAMRLLDASGVVDSRVRQIVERHHERENGSGYPARMLGDAIGLYGRMAGIVDTFLALSGARSYAPALPMDDCLRVLLKARGTLFHAPLVEHFIQMIGLYPVGSLVELSTGEVAAVLSHNRVRRLRPRVLVMIGADGELLPRPMALDLLYQPRDAAGEEIRIVRGLPVGSHGIKAADMFAATVPE